MASYRFVRARLSELDPSTERDWRTILERAPGAAMGHDPDWLRIEFRDRLDQTYGLLIYDDGEPVGLVTFLIKRWPLYVRAGEVKAVTLPITRLCMLAAPLGPDSHALYDRIFQELSDAKDLGFDVIYLEVVAETAFLHTYLTTSATLSKRFREYRPQGMMEHHQILFPKTVDEYWQASSSKTRSTLRRKVKKLGAEMVRYDTTDQLDKYAADCATISKQSYQFHLLGQGIQDQVSFLAQCREAAARGWLRGYVLYREGAPVAFMHGWQYRGVYLYIETAYIQELRDLSPGTVLHVMVIDDMYQHDTPRIFEFGVHGDQKAAFGNQTYLATEWFLIRPSIYPMFATSLYRLSNAGTEAAKKVLDRYGVTGKVKQMMRRLSVR